MKSDFRVGRGVQKSPQISDFIGQKWLKNVGRHSVTFPCSPASNSRRKLLNSYVMRQTWYITRILVQAVPAMVSFYVHTAWTRVPSKVESQTFTVSLPPSKYLVLSNIFSYLFYCMGFFALTCGQPNDKTLLDSRDIVSNSAYLFKNIFTIREGRWRKVL